MRLILTTPNSFLNPAKSEDFQSNRSTYDWQILELVKIKHTNNYQEPENRNWKNQKRFTRGFLLKPGIVQHKYQNLRGETNPYRGKIGCLITFYWYVLQLKEETTAETAAFNRAR